MEGKREEREGNGRIREREGKEKRREREKGSEKEENRGEGIRIIKLKNGRLWKVIKLLATLYTPATYI